MVEKATLDAFYVEEDSPWRTSIETVAKVDQCLSEISRILCPRTGKFVSLSFTPAMFRLPVVARDIFGWDVCPETFDNGGLPYTFYCMNRGGTIGEDVVSKVRSFQAKSASQADGGSVNNNLCHSDEEDFESASKLMSSISISSSEDESTE